jgi:hypothetical protein
MSITSLSFTFVNTYAAPAAKQTAPAEHCSSAEQGSRHSCGESRPAGRQNRLVEAMMSALRELGFGNEATQTTPNATSATSTAAATTGTASDSAAALATGQASAAMAVADSAAATAGSADATADSAAATTEVAQTPQVSVESAVRQFAHELFSALREIGRGEASERGSNRVRGNDGDGGRRHHHGHHGWRREGGYGDMAQRLNALSQTFAAPAAVAAANAAPVSTSFSMTLTIQNGVFTRTPAQAETTNAASAGGTQAVESAQVAATTDTANPADAGATLPATPAAAPVQEAATNPLLEAFSQLFGALKPQAAQTDMADKLRSFLQTLAQAMRPDSMNHAVQMPQVGALVNVTA